MKVTIIGGSGFVGTRLIAELLQREGLDVLNIDKAPSERYPAITEIADVLDPAALQRLLTGTDVVVLLAAEHRDDVSPISLYYDVNVRGTQHVLDAMKVNGIKHIVFTSSVAVYGLDKQNPDESAAIDPFNHYGKSKWQAEEVLQKWQASHADWTIQVVRPTVIFGEGNRGNVYNLLNQIASGKFMMIGPGKNRKSMAYVGNVVSFIQFLIENKKDESVVYNYVDKPDFTTNDLVYHTGEALGKKLSARRIPYWLGMLGGYGFDFLAAITRKKLAISSVRVKKFCAETQYDSVKAMQTGFQPPFAMEEGLRRTLQSEFGK